MCFLAHRHILIKSSAHCSLQLYFKNILTQCENPATSMSFRSRWSRYYYFLRRSAHESLLRRENDRKCFSTAFPGLISLSALHKNKPTISILLRRRFRRSHWIAPVWGAEMKWKFIWLKGGATLSFTTHARYSNAIWSRIVLGFSLCFLSFWKGGQHPTCVDFVQWFISTPDFPNRSNPFVSNSFKRKCAIIKQLPATKMTSTSAPSIQKQSGR